MTFAPAGSPPPPGRGPTREYRAAVAFTIGGAAVLLVVLLASGGILQTSPPIKAAVIVVGVLLGVVGMLGTAYGLSNGRRWAAAVVTPMLLLLVVEGIIETIVAFTHNAIHVPIGALIAVWALRAPMRTPLDPEGGLQAWGAAGVFAFGATFVSTAWPVVTPLLLQNGGPLIVASEALEPTLVLTCNGSPDVAPISVRIDYGWRWTRAEPWAVGNDSITLAASIDRAEDSGGYAIGSDAYGSAGTWQSNIMIFDPKGIVFGIDLAQAGFAPGSVGFDLIAPTENASAHGSIEIRATYLHAPADTNGPESPALWQVITQARCEW